MVPTFNYAVVHARGVLRARHDAPFLLDALAALTRAAEGRVAALQPSHHEWALADAPDGYVASRLASIVGIEIPLDRPLVGKLKMSQNRAPEDQAGVVGGLACLAASSVAAAPLHAGQALQAAHATVAACGLPPPLAPPPRLWPAA